MMSLEQLERLLKTLHEDAQDLLGNNSLWRDLEARVNSLAVLTGVTLVVSSTTLALLCRVYACVRQAAP